MPEKMLIKPKKTESKSSKAVPKAIKAEKSEDLDKEKNSLKISKNEISLDIALEKKPQIDINNENQDLIQSSDEDNLDQKVVENLFESQSTNINFSTSQFQPFPSSTEVSAKIFKEKKVEKLDNTSVTIEKSNRITSENVETMEDSENISYESSNSMIGQQELLEQFDKATISPIQTLQDEFANLTPLEQDILAIAKNILKKKKYAAEVSLDRVETMNPLMEQLYSKCIAKLSHTKGFSKEEIFASLQSLEQDKWIVTTQRRTKKEILEAETLRSVLQFIHEHPGTHARDPEIEQELHITRNPFIKHVMVLDAFGLIRTKKIGRTQNYFIVDVPEIFDDFVVLFHNPLVPEIIRLFLGEPDIGLSEIARRLGVYHGAIQYHIKSLISQNLLLKNEGNLQVNRELLKRYNQLYKHPPFEI